MTARTKESPGSNWRSAGRGSWWSFEVPLERPLHHSPAMTRTLTLAAVLLAACGAPPKESHVPQPGTHSEMKTIDSADVRPAVMQPPPVLTEEAPPPKPKENVAQA